jgi:hypothetical protein
MRNLLGDDARDELTAVNKRKECTLSQMAGLVDPR